MKIKDITSKSVGVWLVAKILDKSPTREIEKSEKLIYVADTIISDDTGKIRLSLWNDQIQQFKKGDVIKINHASVSEWRGSLQLSSKDIVIASEEDMEDYEDKKFHVVHLKNGGQKDLGDF